MEEEVLIEVDELTEAFDSLEESINDTGSKVLGYQQLLLNERADEKALKIKEQCIFRFL